MNLHDSHLDIIQRRCPALKIASARIGPEGLENTMIIMNDELVFRFPISDGDRGQLYYEAKLLAILHGYISLPIPMIEEINDDFAMQRYIPGLPLYGHNLLRYTTTAQDGYARELANFLRELHMIPLDELPNPPLDSGYGHTRQAAIFPRPAPHHSGQPLSPALV